MVFFYHLVFCNKSLVVAQENQNFTVFFDAGHGGKDPGNSPWLYRKKKLKTTLRGW
jgi:N-acetylmuramoyl-L-alanine amidase